MKGTQAVLAITAVVASIGTVSAVRADVKVGDKMPKLKVENLYNNPFDVDVNDLDGYVVVVEFWATWCGPCRASIPHINDIHKRFKDDGVVIVSLSDESNSTVGPFVKEMKMKYLVGSGSTSIRDFGVNAIPRAFLVDPNGIVRWAGHPMAGLDNEIDKAVQKYKPIRRLGGGPEWNDHLLTEIEGALERNDYQTARINLRRLDVESMNPKDTKDKLGQRYANVLSTLSTAAESELRMAMTDIKAKRYETAMNTLKKLAVDFPLAPVGKKATDELKRLQNDPEVSKARRGSFNSKLAANALKRAKGALVAGDKLTAYRRLKALVNKYSETSAADDARKILAKLEADADFMETVNEDDGG